MGHSLNVELSENLATQEAQELRRKELKGKKLLWISCPYADNNAIHKMAADLGLDMWILAQPDCKFSKRCISEGIFRGMIGAEMSNDQNAVANAIEAIQNSGIAFDGIYSPHEISIPMVCQIAEELGFATNSSQSASNARNKLKAREICKNAGLNTPRYAYIHQASDIEAACEFVKFPAVLKPSSGAGSQGVVRVENVAEVRKNFVLLINDMKEHVYLNWNPGCKDGVFVILEQYLVGNEFDVDCLFWDGECKFISVSDNWPTYEPYFMETGSSLPSLFPLQVQEELKDYVIKVVKALGFRMGPFHVETKYGSDGPQLIEVNPRMGGGPVLELNIDVYGVNLFENSLMAACGIPINPPVNSGESKASSLALINSPVTGTIMNTTFLDHVKEHPYFGFLRYKVESGKRVTGLDTGLPDWLAEIRFNGPTAELVDAAMKEFIASIDYPILPDGLPKPSLPKGQRRRSSATELF